MYIAYVACICIYCAYIIYDQYLIKIIFSQFISQVICCCGQPPPLPPPPIVRVALGRRTSRLCSCYRPMGWMLHECWILTPAFWSAVSPPCNKASTPLRVVLGKEQERPEPGIWNFTLQGYYFLLFLIPCPNCVHFSFCPSIKPGFCWS